MEKFEKFMRDNEQILKGAFSTVKPLSDKEKQEAEFERKNGFTFKNDDGTPRFLTETDKELYFARKNKICPVFALCRMAETKYNAKMYRIKISGKLSAYRPKIRSKEQLMAYEDARVKFWNIYLKESVAPNQFRIDNNNKTAVKEILKYFIQDPTCKLDLNKGICLAGGVGTGKTNLIKQFSYFTQDNDLETAFSVESMRKIVREVSSKGLDAINDYLMNDICFDDIAIRQSSLKSYGTEISPLDELIQARYERFIKRTSRPTHFTTNIELNPSDENEYRTLCQMYDERSLDRIRQMCNFVYLGGKSRRV